MTPDEIIDLICPLGDEETEGSHMGSIYPGDIREWLDAAMRLEREACAKVCLSQFIPDPDSGNFDIDERGDACTDCAKAIRARK